MEALRKVTAGQGLQVQTVPEPTAGVGQVLVRVAAAGICGSDLHIDDWERGYHWMAPHVPVTLGHEFAGEVVALGQGVTTRTAGERVVIIPGTVCGTCYYCRRGLPDLCARRTIIGQRLDGGFAPLVAVPASNCLPVPDSVPLPVAAMTEPLAVCARAVDVAGIKPGDSVAVLGPGMIGIGLILMARAAGAGRILVAGRSRDAARLEACRKMGADRTINVDEENVTTVLQAENEGEGVDVVLEATGVPVSIRNGMDAVRRGGTVVAVGIHDKLAEIDTLALVRGKRHLVGSHGSRPIDWARVVKLLPRISGQLESIISHRLPVSAGIEAFRRSREPGSVKVMITP